MLSSLLGKKSNHPLANLKSAQQVLGDVPRTDSLAALQELSGWIESLCERVDEFRLDHQVAVLRLLDEAAQPHVRKVQRDYFAVQQSNKALESRAWTSLNRYFTFSEQMYISILNKSRSGNTSSLNSQLSLLAIRCIVAISNRIKLAAVNYAQIDPLLWGHLVEIYTYAEEKLFLDELISPYSGWGTETSVKREFAGVLVWHSVGTSSLSPTQIHIVERLIANLNKYLEVGTEAGAGSQWVINLAQHKPPLRVFSETKHQSTVRFIGIGAADFSLIELINSLEKGKSIVSQDINMGGAVYEAELVRDVAKHILTRCSLPPPERKNTRRKFKVELQVVMGFLNLVEKTDVGLNFNNAASEIWKTDDISISGFSCVNSPAILNKVKIGTLVGIKPDNMNEWGGGIVRRLSRDVQNNVCVGVEILANQIVGLSLGGNEGGRLDDHHLALFLNKKNDLSGEALLLMRPGSFIPNYSFNLTVEDKEYLLLPLGLLESGDDYELVRYRKMEQDTSNDDAYSH